MSVEGKVQIRMRTSVGTLRAHTLPWVDVDRAAGLVEHGHATYVAPAEPVDVVAAVTSVAADMRAAHKLDTGEGVQADGAKGDTGTGKARARRGAGNGNGSGDQASRLDKSTD
jgi:hypothetical protein